MTWVSRNGWRFGLTREKARRQLDLRPRYRRGNRGREGCRLPTEEPAFRDHTVHIVGMKSPGTRSAGVRRLSGGRLALRLRGGTPNTAGYRLVSHRLHGRHFFIAVFAVTWALVTRATEATTIALPARMYPLTRSCSTSQPRNTATTGLTYA